MRKKSAGFTPVVYEGGRQSSQTNGSVVLDLSTGEVRPTTQADQARVEELMRMVMAEPHRPVEYVEVDLEDLIRQWNLGE